MENELLTADMMTIS